VAVSTAAVAALVIAVPLYSSGTPKRLQGGTGMLVNTHSSAPSCHVLMDRIGG